MMQNWFYLFRTINGAIVCSKMLTTREMFLNYLKNANRQNSWRQYREVSKSCVQRAFGKQFERMDGFNWPQTWIR